MLIENKWFIDMLDRVAAYFGLISGQKTPRARKENARRAFMMVVKHEKAMEKRNKNTPEIE